MASIGSALTSRWRICQLCGRRFLGPKPSKAKLYCSPGCLRESRVLPVGRFWDHVDTSGGPHACWLWTAVRTSAGYGWMSVRGKQTYAHRLVLTLGGVTVPGCSHVMHLCDNPPCVNPSHLRVATNAANLADCVQKGRHQHGSGHWNAALTEADIVAIRRRCGEGERQCDVARDYGITAPNVSMIVAGKRWSHVK